MKIRRALMGLFAPAALALALLATGPQGSGTLLAASSCGPNNGNLCSATKSCTWYLVYSICTTKYKYYPKSGRGTGGGQEDPEKLEVCAWNYPFC